MPDFSPDPLSHFISEWGPVLKAAAEKDVRRASAKKTRMEVWVDLDERRLCVSWEGYLYESEPIRIVDPDAFSLDLERRFRRLGLPKIQPVVEKKNPSA